MGGLSSLSANHDKQAGPVDPDNPVTITNVFEVKSDSRRNIELQCEPISTEHFS